MTPVLSSDAIARRVDELARQISTDYRDADLVMIGVLKGAFVFLADLMRRLQLKRVAIDFIRVASYGGHKESSGSIGLLKDVEIDITGKDVMIVEDILDSGLTLAFLKKHLSALKPRSIKSCVFIDKLERRQVDIHADYVCHTLKEGFLVGYGLDYAEAYRHLPGIFNLNLNQ